MSSSSLSETSANPCFAAGHLFLSCTVKKTSISACQPGNHTATHQYQLSKSYLIIPHQCTSSKLKSHEMISLCALSKIWVRTSFGHFCISNLESDSPRKCRSGIHVHESPMFQRSNAFVRLALALQTKLYTNNVLHSDVMLES